MAGSTQQSGSSDGGFTRNICRFWGYILDLGLTLWVLRAPVIGLIVGCILLLGVPQAQDLLVEPATEKGVRLFAFLGLVFLVWAVPTHYAARLLLETDARYVAEMQSRPANFLSWLKEWSPRILGATTIVAMLGAVWRTNENLPVFENTQVTKGIKIDLAILAVYLALTLLLFLSYAVWRKKTFDNLFVRGAERLAEFVLWPVRGITWLFTGKRRDSDNEEEKEKKRNLGPLLLIFMFILFAFLPLFDPYTFAQWFPRAIAIPVVIGGWLPLLAFFSGMGRAFRVPVIFILLTIVTIVPWWFGDHYGIRLINAGEQVAAVYKVDASKQKPTDGTLTEGIDLVEAIGWWKRANCDAKLENCPRPIIVAAAGGASRAGFFTAGVIGQILDDKLVGADSNGHGQSAETIRKQIFAFSTVSGSSVGAVMTVGALAASSDGKQPCRANADELWWRYGLQSKKLDDWRSCLEALTSGDFLTPIFAGFVFRDVLHFIGWQDRGGLIEKSIEDHFSRMIGGPFPAASGLECLGSLDCPFMTLRPTKDRWLPLLLLNSTSVEWGQRIITTQLNAIYDVGDKLSCPSTIREHPCLIFSNSQIFHNLLRGDAREVRNDVRLSTAAHNSARFPLLSPPGEIRNSNDRLVDRLVDGGYFENFGAQTATELAQAIMAIDKNLKPFVLVLSNDPTVKTRITSPISWPTAPNMFLTDISAPLTAFSNVRNARGTLAVDTVAVPLDQANLNQCNVAVIRVWSDPTERDSSQARELSMSWWLSKPVQRYLHEQTEFLNGAPTNRHENEKRIRYLLDALSRPAINAKAGDLCSQD